MVTIDSEPDILPPTAFSGWIQVKEVQHEVTFSVSAGPDGHLKIDLDPLSTDTLFALSKAIGKSGSRTEDLTLHGEGDNGSEFHSDYVLFTGTVSGSVEIPVSLSHRQSTVTLKLEGNSGKPLARLWLRGFKSFRNSVVNTQLGMLQVQGDHKNVERDSMSGSIAVQAHTHDTACDWFSQADDLLTFMMRGLGFAHGGRLQTPRLDQVSGGVWKATFYSGSGFRSGLPAIHKLMQADYIKALARRYESDVPFPDILWTAIGWLHSGTSIHEVDFLTSMTALEAIVEHMLPKDLTTIISKQEFNPLKEKLIRTVSLEELPAEPSEIFIGKIRSLNGRSLSQKLAALKEHYGLPDAPYDQAAIVRLIKIRNEIVHKGVIPEGTDLWPEILLVREMIGHIFFHEIGYQGPFESYVGGHRTVDRA